MSIGSYLRLESDIKVKYSFSQLSYDVTYNNLKHTTTENLTIMGKVNTSYLMTIIRWIINISARSPKLEWASLTHTTPYIANKIRKVTKGIISYTHSWHDIPNMHLRTPLESFSVGVQCKWANLHNDDNERKQHAWSRTRPYGHCVFGSLYRTWSCITYTLRQL